MSHGVKGSAGMNGQATGDALDGSCAQLRAQRLAVDAPGHVGQLARIVAHGPSHRNAGGVHSRHSGVLQEVVVSHAAGPDWGHEEAAGTDLQQGGQAAIEGGVVCRLVRL